MHSDDPEERIRELERQLAEAKGGPRENVRGPYDVPPVRAPGAMTPFQPDTVPPPPPDLMPPPPPDLMQPPPPDLMPPQPPTPARFPPPPGMMPPPPPPGVTPAQPTGVDPASYHLLPHQRGRRRRFGSVWPILLVPGMFVLIFLILFGYTHYRQRAATHCSGTSASALPTETAPTGDPAHALTVLPGGNMTIGGCSQTSTFVCNYGDITVEGNTNLVYVTGHCAHLTVKGSHNKIIADTADTIATDGANNQVVYHTGAPQITNGGSGNTVNNG